MVARAIAGLIASIAILVAVIATITRMDAVKAAPKVMEPYEITSPRGVIVEVFCDERSGSLVHATSTVHGVSIATQKAVDLCYPR